MSFEKPESEEPKLKIEEEKNIKYSSEFLNRRKNDLIHNFRTATL